MSIISNKFGFCKYASSDTKEKLCTNKNCVISQFQESERSKGDTGKKKGKNLVEEINILEKVVVEFEKRKLTEPQKVTLLRKK